MKLKNPFAHVQRRKEFYLDRPESSINGIDFGFVNFFRRICEIHAQGYEIERYSVKIDGPGIRFTCTRWVSAWRAFFSE